MSQEVKIGRVDKIDNAACKGLLHDQDNFIELHNPKPSGFLENIFKLLYKDPKLDNHVFAVHAQSLESFVVSSAMKYLSEAFSGDLGEQGKAAQKQLRDINHVAFNAEKVVAGIKEYHSSGGKHERDTGLAVATSCCSTDSAVFQGESAAYWLGRGHTAWRGAEKKLIMEQLPDFLLNILKKDEVYTSLSDNSVEEAILRNELAHICLSICKSSAYTDIKGTQEHHTAVMVELTDKNSVPSAPYRRVPIRRFYALNFESAAGRQKILIKARVDAQIPSHLSSTREKEFFNFIHSDGGLDNAVIVYRSADEKQKKKDLKTEIKKRITQFTSDVCNFDEYVKTGNLDSDFLSDFFKRLVAAHDANGFYGLVLIGKITQIPVDIFFDLVKDKDKDKDKDKRKQLIEKVKDKSIHLTPDPLGRTPLYRACQKGHLAVVNLLLATGVDVNKAITKDGTTPLFIACEKGHLAVVSALLAAGANVDQVDKNDVTPLLMACENGHLAVVSALLAAGADVNQADQNGWTLLLIACHEGHLEVVKALIAAGANVNQAITKDGTTPLSIACRRGHIKIMEHLLSHGGEGDIQWSMFGRCVFNAVDQSKNDAFLIALMLAFLPAVWLFQIVSCIHAMYTKYMTGKYPLSNSEPDEYKFNKKMLSLNRWIANSSEENNISIAKRIAISVANLIIVPLSLLSLIHSFVYLIARVMIDSIPGRERFRYLELNNIWCILKSGGYSAKIIGKLLFAVIIKPLAILCTILCTILCAMARAVRSVASSGCIAVTGSRLPWHRHHQGYGRGNRGHQKVELTGRGGSEASSIMVL